MLRRFTGRGPARGPNLPTLFGLTVLLPGLLLAVIGARAFVQERRYSAQQATEQLHRGAEAAASVASGTWSRWTTALTRLDWTRPALEPIAGTDLGRALQHPGAAIVILASAGQPPDVWPPAALLYRPTGAPGAPKEWPASDPALRAAEELEVRDHDYARAAAAYRALAERSTPDVRPVVQHRLARTLRKAGHDAAAARLFEQLADDDRTSVGGVPLGLVAAFELRSPTLYADLVSGRWLVDRTRFAFYADAAAAWSEPARRTALDLQRDGKRTLTEAVESLLSGSAQQTHVQLGPAPTPTGTVTALVSLAWMREQVWSHAFAQTIAQGLDLRLTMPGGHIAFESPGSRGHVPEGLMASADLGRDAAGWQVTVSPADPAAFTARFERQRLLYFLLLVLVIGLLGFGSYATARAVRRELEVAQIQSDFVATVSHELRSPLTAIRQLTELLVRGRVADEARRARYYEQIAREGDRLSRLVDNLLDFARMENGAKDYHFEPIEPASWLRRLAAEAGHHYASRGVSIAADIPDRLPEIIADPTALACAVENLLDNAVKYSPGRDTVWVSAASGAHGVTIVVRDAGVGIGATDQARVFEKFYRARAPITQRVKGAGLGLSLVQRIVEAHGGSVAVESQPGVGTTFAIHLRAA